MARFMQACDEALIITRNFASAQEQCVFEDARSFFDVSELEMCLFTRTTSSIDLVQLQKLSRDAQNQNLFKVRVLQEALITHLMTETVRFTMYLSVSPLSPCDNACYFGRYRQ